MFDPPGRPKNNGSSPNIVDWLLLVHHAPNTEVNTADAADILNVGAVRVRRLIKAGTLKPVAETKPYVLRLGDVLRYRNRKRPGEGGAS